MRDLPFVPGRSDLAEAFGGSALPSESNAGLVFDRYARVWDRPDGLPDQRAIREWLGPFITAYNHLGRAKAVQPLLDDLHARLDLVPAARCTLVTTTRFTTGLGAGHIAQNGFTLDRNLGVPYLPGSGIKGLLRAWFRVSGDDSVSVPEQARWFGKEPGSSDPTSVSEVRFLSAYPLHIPKLELDIVNNHHSRYTHDPRAGAVDTESPVPAYFLTVAPGTPFVFRVGGREGRRRDADRVIAALRSALELFGAGAKTASGYGLFSEA